MRGCSPDLSLTGIPPKDRLPCSSFWVPPALTKGVKQAGVSVWGDPVRGGPFRLPLPQSVTPSLSPWLALQSPACPHSQRVSCPLVPVPGPAPLLGDCRALLGWRGAGDASDPSWFCILPLSLVLQGRRLSRVDRGNPLR